MPNLAVGAEKTGASRADEPALHCRGVTFRYARPANAGGGTLALDDVTLLVRTGERLGILGPNGGGKSTLVKLMLGLLKPESGAIEVFGQPPESARRAGLVGYVPQRVEAELDFPLSVRQVVSMSAERGTPPWRGLGREARAAVDESLELVGISALGENPIGKLSGGQLQRAMIARALASRPKVLILDEPTVGIDVSGQQRFAALLQALHRRLGLTLVIVSHDIRVIAAGSDRVACLSRTLHFHDAPQGLTPKVLAEVFRHDVAGIFGDVHVAAHAAGACPPGCGHDHGVPPATTTAGGAP